MCQNKQNSKLETCELFSKNVCIELYVEKWNKTICAKTDYVGLYQ